MFNRTSSILCTVWKLLRGDADSDGKSCIEHFCTVVYLVQYIYLDRPKQVESKERQNGYTLNAMHFRCKTIRVNVDHS